jgi:hypothetical protein
VPCADRPAVPCADRPAVPCCGPRAVRRAVRGPVCRAVLPCRAAAMRRAGPCGAALRPRAGEPDDDTGVEHPLTTKENARQSHRPHLRRFPPRPEDEHM